MLDLARGPFVVGVADRVEALAACAKLARRDRPFDLVEARVDLFSNQRLEPAGREACAALEASGTPVLVTIRSATQGGRFAAGERVRLERFREALVAASWADIEDDAEIIGEVAALVGARAEGQLVVSHHDFSETPSLDSVREWVDACHAAAKGAVAKVATAIRSPGDEATLRALLRERPARTAVIGMSAEDEGLRVALAAAGSLLAYGYLSQPTAPGQMSAQALHDRLLATSTSYADRRERRSLAI
jgi:3-dehydroquinate dehydratase-1